MFRRLACSYFRKMESGINTQLLHKYSAYVPRYTSYPTVPQWKDNLDIEEWQSTFVNTFITQNLNGISLYIHLPFCESLCSYCGCNKKITTNHAVEGEYLLALQKEWLLYKKLMKQTPIIREIHLGGGTPTFFSPLNLQRLIQFILKGSIIHPNHEFSIEGHPNNTTNEHLKSLAALGFKRISFGVQDTDDQVQQIINRIQPLENVKKVTESARSNGFTSINYDLIYGLPLQTIRTIEKTVSQVIALDPDRIAFYSYAHMPSKCRNQRLFDETNLPDAEEKINMYKRGKQLLTENGYKEIGMDHFAKPHDGLFVARKSGRLYRNFMGYTTLQTGIVLGLGVSSISDTGCSFAQNEKKIHNYYAKLNAGKIPIEKGYLLTEEDHIIKKYIQDIICRGTTNFNPEHLAFLKTNVFPKLHELQKDGLLIFNDESLSLTDQGQFFVRYVCYAFDQYHALPSLKS